MTIACILKNLDEYVTGLVSLELSYPLYAIPGNLLKEKPLQENLQRLVFYRIDDLLIRFNH